MSAQRSRRQSLASQYMLYGSHNIKFGQRVRRKRVRTITRASRTVRARGCVQRTKIASGAMNWLPIAHAAAGPFRCSSRHRRHSRECQIPDSRRGAQSQERVWLGAVPQLFIRRGVPTHVRSAVQILATVYYLDKAEKLGVGGDGRQLNSSLAELLLWQS